MIIEITRDNYDIIKNPIFSRYAAIYLDIYDNFLEQISTDGLALDDHDYSKAVATKKEQLRQKGAILRNGGRSVYVNAISPACVACQTGVESSTFFISLKCHRDCYFCFNANQVDYEYYSEHKRDVIGELDAMHAAGATFTNIAVTGGEPLLFPEELITFFKHAKALYPEVYLRLYTCGDHLNDEILGELQAAGLNEIRLSIRMHDLERGIRHSLEAIALAKKFIPEVMVEMPVLPDAMTMMQDLLVRLDDLQIASINLLEFCYPYAKPEQFIERGYLIKKRPYQIPYNYWYAGGMPISGSEMVCLDLMEFAIDRELNMGVHYCSLENKFTAQIYEQNTGKPVPDVLHLSPNGYFFKSAKVFGDDIPTVLQVFDREDIHQYQYNEDHSYLEFHVDHVRALRKLDIEVGIASSVIESRDGETYLREVKVDFTTPRKFKRHKDI